MTVVDDTIRGLTLGDPDGPLQFIDTLGQEVPTYLDPRLDLLPNNGKGEGKFKRVNYHVPFKLRGEFKVSDWPEAYRQTQSKPRVDTEGFVLCAGISRGGGLCAANAVNRTHFCRNHGGALHPADKKISPKTLATIPEDRVDALDRPQQFMQGFLTPEDLTDEEVQGGFIRNNAGQVVKSRALGIKFEQQIAKELHSRLNRFLQSKASSMLHVMVDIAENDLYEASDRVKAATWVAERVMGKTPEVLLTGQVNAPYVGILDSLEGGSREDYRKSVKSQRGEVGDTVDQTEGILDAEVEDDGDTGYDGDVSEHQRDDQRPSENPRDDESAQRRSERIEMQRKDRKAASDRIRKAKQRRYAARAVGATSLSDIPWLPEFLPTFKDGKLVGHKMKLWPPDEQTPAVVDRIMASYRAMKVEDNGEEPSS
jgi:hypothetical protein